MAFLHVAVLKNPIFFCVSAKASSLLGCIRKGCQQNEGGNPCSGLGTDKAASEVLAAIPGSPAHTGAQKDRGVSILGDI